MPKLLENLKQTAFAIIPDREDLAKAVHPRLDFLLLVLRNIFVGASVLFFVAALFIQNGPHNVLKVVGYFAGAAAYIFECLAVTDCFQTKVRHTEMFMVY
ncbi:MAG: hypothetical protein PUF48_02030 [Oscillospiraceae bacterium]|nr:hypothetical protein [Oscillospiraceae bacterium]